MTMGLLSSGLFRRIIWYTDKRWNVLPTSIKGKAVLVLN
jgi:hypothetical protein